MVTLCHSDRMRPSRLIYVENDPTLRSVMAEILGARPELELILVGSGSDDVLGRLEVTRADVALIDLALGPSSLTGIDLGLALRELNPDIGIVVHSQHSVERLDRKLPTEARMGWSFLPKSGVMDTDDLVQALLAAARGIGTVTPESAPGATPLDALTQRQRSVMSLAATGISAQQIAVRLGLTHDVVRQDLSKAYRLLVPDSQPGDDLRTRAILAYLSLVREADWGAR